MADLIAIGYPDETTAFEAGLTGMIGLAARCDSRLAGPDTNEFTSNAVTE